MVMIRRIPREQMRRNHAEKAEVLTAKIPRTTSANIETLLDMGDTTYIMFRGAPYGVPPVGWRLGLDLLALRQAAEVAAVGGLLTRDTTGAYRDALARMASLIWEQMMPVGNTPTGTVLLGWRKRLRLMRNPVQGATEQDIVVLCDFVLRRRMNSSTGVRPTPRPGT